MPTEWSQTVNTCQQHPPLAPHAVTTHWIQSAELERTEKRRGADRRRFLGPAADDAVPSYNSPAGGQSHLRGRLLATTGPVATLPRGKCASRPKPRRRTVQRIRERPRAAERPVESPEDALRLHPFTSKRFHVLLNSLFKVLFNFPSRYLSAIGLVPVFSLRWGLPPALGCIPKQPDSEDSRCHGDAGQ